MEPTYSKPLKFMMSIPSKKKEKKMRGSCLFKVGIFLLVNLIEIQGENLCTDKRSSGILSNILGEYIVFKPRPSTVRAPL